MLPANTISPCDAFALIGRARSPCVIDVRLDEDRQTDARLVPSSVRVRFDDIAGLLKASSGRDVVVVCQKGLKLSEGSAALLRRHGTRAAVLAGGFAAWREAGLPLIPAQEHVRSRADGTTLWVTRQRPKIDRIACPWLIRRFVDPGAEFIFVAADQVAAVAERFAANPFDIEETYWSHRGDQCTFDLMLQDFQLATPAMLLLAAIVRGADTGAFDVAPQAAGLLAVSLGLSQLHCDDNEQLEAGLMLYDALYLWCRDARQETHAWPGTAGRRP